MIFGKHLVALGAAFAGSLSATAETEAHPHVYAQARMEIVGDGATGLQAIRNIWRMDEIFSASVVVDYDKNGNGTLDDDELRTIADTVKESIAEFGFYTFVRKAGAPVTMLPPDDLRTLFQDGQLLIFFEMKPADAIDLSAQAVTVAAFDETFFTAFDFGDGGFQLVDLPAACKESVVVPNEDEAAQEWMASIAALGPDESVPESGANFGEILATRAEIKCG